MTEESRAAWPLVEFDTLRRLFLLGLLSLFVSVMMSEKAYGYQLRSAVMEREAARYIKMMMAEGFVYESSGDDDINKDTALTIRHSFKAGHRYVVVAYVENCGSCDLQMQYFPSGSSQGKKFNVDLERSGQHTKGIVSIRPDASADGKIETFVESSVPRYAVVLFFTRSY